jgi:hypothetical protein
MRRRPFTCLRPPLPRKKPSRQAAIEEAAARGEAEPRFDGITLRQRLVPLIDMLRRSGAAGKEVVWGV